MREKENGSQIYQLSTLSACQTGSMTHHLRCSRSGIGSSPLVSSLDFRRTGPSQPFGGRQSGVAVCAFRPLQRLYSRSLQGISLTVLWLSREGPALENV